MRVLISGSTGLIGRKLTADLSAAGDTVVRLVRRASGSDDAISWNPETGEVDSSHLEGFDAVVHLAGESIANGRWTPAKKRRIRDSRVVGTRHLAEVLAKLSRPPQVFVGASAIGIYGNRGDEVLDESSPPGSGFLADVCQEWEDAARPLSAADIRLALVRTGVVLDGKGGALAQMKLPFLLGLGGRLGDGRQYMSWISLEDIVGAFRHAMTNREVTGPINGVAPAPVTNAEFTRALGKALHRPTLFPVPRIGARILLGEMSDALLFASQRVSPTRLLATGYRFRHADLASALSEALG